MEGGTDAMLNIVSGFGSRPAYVSMIMTRKVGINLGSLGKGGGACPASYARNKDISLINQGHI